MDTVIIKEFTEADIPEIRNIFFACNDYFQLIDGVSVCGCRADTEFNTSFQGQKQRCQGIYAVEKTADELGQQEQLIGLVFLMEKFANEENLAITLLLITPENRGKGIGKLVLNKIIEDARKADFKRVLVGVDEINADAISFWEGNGFVDNGQRQKLMHTNRVGEIIYLEKVLS